MTMPKNMAPEIPTNAFPTGAASSSSKVDEFVQNIIPEINNAVPKIAAVTTILIARPITLPYSHP